jgi:hypothetical protein
MIIYRRTLSAVVVDIMTSSSIYKLQTCICLAAPCSTARRCAVPRYCLLPRTAPMSSAELCSTRSTASRSIALGCLAAGRHCETSQCCSVPCSIATWAVPWHLAVQRAFAAPCSTAESRKIAAALQCSLAHLHAAVLQCAAQFHCFVISRSAGGWLLSGKGREGTEGLLLACVRTAFVCLDALCAVDRPVGMRAVVQPREADTHVARARWQCVLQESTNLNDLRLISGLRSHDAVLIL